MDDELTQHDLTEPEAHEGVLERPGNRPLPRLLDQEVAMQLVQQCVEAERIRNRRILIWMSTIFLLVMAFVLVVFVAVGITVLARSKQATHLVQNLQTRTAGYEADLVDVSGRLQGVENGTVEIKSGLENAELSRTQESRILKTDLGRFSQWVNTQNARSERAVTILEERLAKMEKQAAVREAELKRVREQYTTLRVGIAGAGAVAASDRVSAASDAGPVTAAAVTATPPAVAVAPKVEVAVVSFSNGDRYEGQFRDGLFDGWGVYHYANGDRYEGEFANDMKVGRGTMAFAGGDRFTGEFKSDMINGKGTMVYRNGNRYAGDFKNALRHGNGVLTFRNGDVYKGDFSEDQRTGRGTYIFGDGAKYIGAFLDGRRHGEGRYVYAGGEEYSGQFKDGRKHGVGECVYPNGERIRGVWSDDKFVRALD